MQLQVISERGWMGAAILGLTAATALLAQQPGYNQIYSFGTANVGLTGLTGTGNTLYGATRTGGTNGMGSVYALTLPATAGESWTYTTLYNFGSHAEDGIYPWGVSVGGSSAGMPVLYGTTEDGGEHGKGSVFCLVPPSAPGGEWAEHVLYSFSGPDGLLPLAPLVVDYRAGELPVLYGTTGAGGASYGVSGTDGVGAIFSLTPPATGLGAWTESVLYSFVFAGPASDPNNVVLGRGPCGAPVLYGFALIGGTLDGGQIFSLTESGGTWTYNDIYDPPPSVVISSPTGLTIGSDGVLYGTLEPGPNPDGGDNGGQVYSLTPPTSPGGAWTVNTLYTFGAFEEDGSGPHGVIMASNGTLYGTTANGGDVIGTVYSLTPPASPGGTWTENQLYRFSGDTGAPTNLVIGPHGALYGTTGYFGTGSVAAVYAIER